MPEALSERDIRRQLGEILDSLNELPTDAFAERSALRDRQEVLRKALREFEVEGSKEIKERWSEQAGRKSPEDKGQPVIPSVIEGGGGGASGGV